jgi:hypothetical protein
VFYPKRGAFCEISNNPNDGELLAIDPYLSLEKVRVLAARGGTNDETLEAADRFSSQQFKFVILRGDQAVSLLAQPYSAAFELHQPLEYMRAYVSGTRARLRGEGFRARSGILHEDCFVGQFFAFVILDLVVPNRRELLDLRLLPDSVRGQSREQLGRAKWIHY